MSVKCPLNDEFRVSSSSRPLEILTREPTGHLPWSMLSQSLTMGNTWLRQVEDIMIFKYLSHSSLKISGAPEPKAFRTSPIVLAEPKSVYGPEDTGNKHLQPSGFLDEKAMVSLWTLRAVSIINISALQIIQLWNRHTEDCDWRKNRLDMKYTTSMNKVAHFLFSRSGLLGDPVFQARPSDSCRKGKVNWQVDLFLES